MGDNPVPAKHFASSAKITRRAFLAGAAAVPAGTMNADWVYADDDEDMDDGADLVFILAADERSVIVRRIRPTISEKEKNATATKSGLHDDWLIQAASFGPGAWFDMGLREYAASPDLRYLAIRGISYGIHDRSTKGHSLYVVLEFRREAVTDAKSGGRHPHLWTVGLNTNIWPGNGKDESFRTELENRKRLYRFMAPNSTDRLTEILSAGRISSSLVPMFDEQLIAQGQMVVGLDADMNWNLEALPGAATPLTAFDGKVEGPPPGECLKISWQDLAENGVVSQGRRLVAECVASWKESIVFDSADAAVSGRVEPVALSSDTDRGTFFVGQLGPLSSVSTQGGLQTDAIVALMSWPQAKVTCHPSAFAASAKAPRPSCSELPLFEVRASRIKLSIGKDAFWRNVVVADAAGHRNANPVETREGKKETAKEAKEESKEEPAEDRPLVALQTAIGRLDVRALPVDAGTANLPQSEDFAEIERRLLDAAAAAAIGDRSGVSDRTFFLLADSAITPKKPPALPLTSRLYADVALLGMDTALGGTSDSALTFADSHFRLHYSNGQAIPLLMTPEAAWNTPDGFLWLGKAKSGAEAAAINLGSARLFARRDRDLVDLQFRFIDFVLAFAADNNLRVGTTPPLLRPAREDCRAFSSAGHGVDSRPILGVEFSPQHVMEEAFFRPDPEPLPDTEWPKGEKMPDLATLLAEPDAVARLAMRKMVGEAKVLLEAAAEAVVKPSVNAIKAPFASLRATLAGEKLPEEQKEYIGPFGMSPEAIRIARQWQADKNLERFDGEKGVVPNNGIIARMLAQAGEIGAPAAPNWTLAELLAAEAEAEKIYPLYKLWRDAFRAYVIEIRLTDKFPEVNLDDPVKAEFFNENHKPKPTEEYLPNPALLAGFRTQFIETISGREPLDRLSMARLSSTSRLSFRVNCEPAPGDSSETNGLPPFPVDSMAQPGPGVQRFGSMKFSLATLTDWSRHEPHVTRRAQKLYEPLPSGSVLPVAGRTANIDDHAILESQEFTRGPKGAEAHLGQVRASLQKRPEGLETAIELPARVILSTAQDAVWQTPRKVNRGKLGEANDIFETDPENERSGQDFESYEPLWTARLLAREAQPSVRAVWSPDMRPEAIGFAGPSEAKRPRIAGAPPRGPWAPWVLRREHVDGVRLSPRDVGLASGQSEADSVCTIEAKDSKKRPTMFERVCEIFRMRALYPNSDLHMFQTSLDAYDRHELVLLSSAYGLPVTGKRKQIGDDDDKSGELVERSGQFEPGEDFHITDGKADLAYYRPKPLDVTELSLTALGGFLTHDTNFQPPAPALTYDDRPMFDGLSIERWQHQIVLGRDVLATVVYSGYLFPLGHKASLVKLTERIFVNTGNEKARDPGLGIKAILRQRMFVRVSSPSKKFPAVGQPNRGRQWCAEDVTMLTRQTPDIVDPTFELDTPQGAESLSGRIRLDGPGLAFWPQTAMTKDARVRFEFLIDGRRARLPLIFADRIAAKNPTALAALIRYYTNRDIVPDDWRRADLGGQTLRFAESMKEGDTSFATESILVSVEGRRSDDNSWAGANNVVGNTGVLEGADQPPFYPVMHSARIRIEQAERMSGSSIGPTMVRFDGSYVKYGFDQPPGQADGDNPKTAKNAAQIFLYVGSGSPPEMRMGPNGNQSGGIGRPDMRIVALSRSKGIMGASKDARIYKIRPDASQETYPGKDEKAPLHSVADFFSLPPRDGTRQTNGRALTPASQGDPTAVFKSFFSADAKLLGVVSFEDLMALMQLAGGVDAMPILKEAVDYGSQALAKLQSGSADAMDLLRSEILFPLLTLVRTARAQWSKLSARATSAQGDVIGDVGKIFGITPQSLAQLYPEIDRGLNSLEIAIDKAASETDPLKMLGRLAAVHESGRQFMRELSRLAANPMERLEQAAQAQFDAADKNLRQQVDNYRAAADKAATALSDAIANQAEMLGKRLLDDILGWEALDDVSLLLELLDASSASEVKDLVKKVRDGLAVTADLSDVPSALIKEPRPFPGDVFAAAAEKVLKAADNAATETIDDVLKDDSGDIAAVVIAKAQLRSVVFAYRSSLRAAEKNVKIWTTGQQPAARQWQVWIAKSRRIERLLQLLQELVTTGSPSRGFAILLEIGRDYLGIDVSQLNSRLKSEQKKLVDWTGPVIQRLRVLANDAAGATDIQPRLPSGVFEACLAKTPVSGVDASEDAKKDARKAAKAIADALKEPPQHWRAAFAASVADSFDVEENIEKIAEKSSKLPYRKAATALRGQLETYRAVFCEVFVVVGRIEKAHDTLVQAVSSLASGTDVDKNLRLALQSLRSLGQELEDGLGKIQEGLEKIVDALSQDAPVIAKAIEVAVTDGIIDTVQKSALDKWHADVAQGLLTAANAMFRAAGAAASMVSQPGIDGLAALAAAVRDGLPAHLDPERENFAGALSGLNATLYALADRIGSFRLEPTLAPKEIAVLLAAKLDGTTTVARAFAKGGIARTEVIQEAFDRVVESYDKLETRVVELPGQFADAALDKIVKALLAIVKPAYAKIVGIRGELYEKAAAYPVARKLIRDALLVPPLSTPCLPLTVDCDKLHEEMVALDALADSDNPVSKDGAALQSFSASIAGGRSAVETIMENFQDIWSNLARGNVAALVDISALRDEIEELISQLIPVKQTLNYSLGFDFDASAVGSATGGVFKPLAPGRFELDMTATIDLIKLKADMKAVGHISAFDIALIGDVFDAVTLKFDGIDFSYEAGGSPRFDVHYKDFVIGKQLKFVEQLQSYMTPSKDGSGFFIEPSRDRPGITAGYGLNLGTIQLGGTAFSNVLLAAAADLPFDNEPAVFRFSLGRPLAPFLISVPPFGGGGFVAIYADADGFKGFEASMEFGGVADFSAGPLVAVARLTSGFYIRSMRVKVDGKDRTLTDIYGTFFVGGAASLWIFDFYASLYVRLGMTADGAMEGIATFTFSFSMGIVDYDFSVTAKKKKDALGNDGTRSIDHMDVPADVDTSIITRSTATVSPNVDADTVTLSATTLDDFLAYFDLSLSGSESVHGK